VLFRQTHMVQPASMQHDTQSQQAWIISQHFWSPEVQVIVQPSGVMSHLHMPIVRLQVQTVTPLSVQQTEHSPPIRAVHRFCIMLLAVGSSQTQVIFMPPWHFSTFMVQRGTIIQLGTVGAAVGAPIPGMPATEPAMPGMAIPVRSIITLAMIRTPFQDRPVGRP
jgi:hypothetical protein